MRLAENMPGRGREGRFARAGFTIIEILIAIVVLVLGITGIVALFPTAIESGNKTVEDTYAATITQSVVDAITMNLRESRYSYTAGDKDRPWTYFIFNHDGVLDAAPTKPQDFDYSDPAKGEIWERDFCVVLPQARGDDANKVGKKEPFFLYPVPAKVDRDYKIIDKEGGGFDASKMDQRSPSKLASPTSLIDNFSTDFRLEAADGDLELWYPRVYPLGRYRESSEVPSAKWRLVRDEFRGEKIKVGPDELETIALDPYPTYSFAFAIMRARTDSDNSGSITTEDYFSNSLFELRIMIFKNFDPEIAAELGMYVKGGGATGSAPPVPKTNIPVRRFITLISI